MFNNADPREAGLWNLLHDGKRALVSDHFRVYEFRCPGENSLNIHPVGPVLLEKIREEIGGPLFISEGGGWRTDAYHLSIYERLNEYAPPGSPLLIAPALSAHLVACGWDIWSNVATPPEIQEIAEDLDVGGLGRYEDFTHVDILGFGRRW